MTKYNTLNVKLSNSQLSKLKSETKTQVTLKLSSNVFGDSHGETNFPHKKLLTNIHVFRGFVKLLRIVDQTVKNFQKLNYIK